MPTTLPHWRLDGKECTLIVLQHDRQAMPGCAYWGPLLPPNLSGQLAQLADSALPFGTIDKPSFPTLFPEASTAWPGSPALEGHRQGRCFAHRFVPNFDPAPATGVQFGVADEHHERAPQQQIIDLPQVVETTGAGGTRQLSLDIAARCCASQLSLCLHLVLDADNDVLHLSCSLTNDGDDSYTVNRLASASLPIPDTHAELVTQHGRWGREQQELRRPLGFGSIMLDNRQGRTSHEHSPLMLTGEAGFNARQGDCTLSTLAFSGNYRLQAERLANGDALLQVSTLPLPGELQLEPGQSITTPALLTTRADGINTCSQRLHRHARSRLLPGYTRRPRPVHANSWEALYFNHAADELATLIDAAADIGAERFVLDDGWFAARRDDTAGLGDWWVDRSVYPEGLHAVVERVRGHGMQFGLWFEPEMVNPDSELYRKHPDWVLHVDGIETPMARQQLVLDIARAEVSDYLYSCIATLVDEYQIDYIKWDHNRSLVLPGDGSKPRALAQVDALYKLLARLGKRFPSLEIESCSSGGARADLGILAHTGRVWISDNIDPMDRIAIQAGFLRFLPPEIMGAHVGHERAHLTDRYSDLHLRAIVALQGQFGFELDARRLSPEDKQLLGHYTALYKQNRQWLNDAVYHELPNKDAALRASLLCASDGHLAWLFVFACTSLDTQRPSRLTLEGLDPASNYRLRLISRNAESIAAFNRHLPAWLDGAASDTSSILVSGTLLLELGLPLPVMPPQSALLVSLERLPSTEPSSTPP